MAVVVGASEPSPDPMPPSQQMQKEKARLQAVGRPLPRGKSLAPGPLSARWEQACPLKKHFSCSLEFSNSPSYGSQMSLVPFVVIVGSGKGQLFSSGALQLGDLLLVSCGPFLHLSSSWALGQGGHVRGVGLC